MPLSFTSSDASCGIMGPIEIIDENSNPYLGSEITIVNTGAALPTQTYSFKVVIEKSKPLSLRNKIRAKSLGLVFSEINLDIQICG